MKTPHPRNARPVVQAPISDDYTPHPAVSIPTDADRVEPDEEPSAMLGEIAMNVENLMLADLRFINGFLEPDDDPSMAETIQLTGHVALPEFDGREPEEAHQVGQPTPLDPASVRINSPRKLIARIPVPPLPIPPLFALGGVPPGEGDLRSALITMADELIDHGGALRRLALSMDDPLGYVACILDRRSGDVSGVAVRLGMLGRLFARLGIEGDGRPRGA